MDEILDKLGDICGAMNAEPVPLSPSMEKNLLAAASEIFPSELSLNTKELQVCLLQLLQKQSLDGMAMVSLLEKRNIKAQDGQGALYGALNRMESKGLVEARWREVSNRMVKEYTITEKGEKFIKPQSLSQACIARLQTV